MTAQLRRLRLRNFKCFLHCEVSFGPLTLVSGGNSVGKSSLLQAILLLRQSAVHSAEQGGTHLRLNGDLVSLGRAWDVFSTDAEEGGIELAAVWNDDSEGNWEFGYAEKERILPGIGAGNFEGSDRTPFQSQFIYLQADRHAPNQWFPLPRAPGLSLLGARGEYAPAILAQMGLNEVRPGKVAHPDAKSDRVRDHVEAWLGEMCRPTRVIAEEHPKLDLVELTFQAVNGRELGPPQRPTSVGFGLTYSLPVILALVVTMPGDCVVIENPEAHLHPAGQVLIGELCARAASDGVQVIVETHSDHVLNGIRRAVLRRLLRPQDAVINFLEPEGPTVRLSSPSIDESGRLDFWPSGFFDEWDKVTMQLLSDG